jgi:uncharacterized protein (TIGR02265 family)
LGRAVAKVKGATVITVVKSLRNAKERARALLPPRLHRYLEERILASNWYPAADHLELLRALAKILQENDPGLGDGAYRLIGAMGAQIDAANLYEQVLRRADPEQALKRASVMWRIYFDSGSLEMKRTGPRAARGELRGLDLVTWELCATITGFVEAVARIAGGPQTVLDKTACRARGDESCIWELSW